MYGTYAWQAGAPAANIVADLLALLGGAAVADLSATANKPACSVAGAASGWVAVDAAYGVVSRAGQAGGPGMVARLTVSATPRLQLAAVDQWAMGSHSAGFSTAVVDCSTATSAAGAVNFVATGDGLLIAAADWSYWAMVAEVKRDGPALNDAAAPGAVLVNNNGYCYMPRIKAPAAVGDLTNPNCALTSAYGSLSAAAARDRTEKLYLPIVPATVSYSNVPVGELAGPVVVGGYGQSGDFVQDGNGDQYQIAKYNAVLLAIKRA